MSQNATSWTDPYYLATVAALLVLGALFVTLGTYRPSLVEPAAAVVVMIGMTMALARHLFRSMG